MNFSQFFCLASNFKRATEMGATQSVAHVLHAQLARSLACEPFLVFIAHQLANPKVVPHVLPPLWPPCGSPCNWPTCPISRPFSQWAFLQPGPADSWGSQQATLIATRTPGPHGGGTMTGLTARVTVVFHHEAHAQLVCCLVAVGPLDQC